MSDKLHTRHRVELLPFEHLADIGIGVLHPEGLMNISCTNS